MREAFAYLRVSGLAQVHGDGLDRQAAAIAAYAQEHAITIVRVFREEGVSGKNECDDRPAMREMFESFNGVRLCIVERLDRLARDLIIQEGLIAKFRECGIELLSTVEDDLCSDDPTRVFIRQILGAVAQLDRSLIVKKLKAARDRKRAAGQKCEGRYSFPHGEAENEVFGMMLGLYAQGYNPTRIAAYLNAQGILSRSGGKWHSAVVARILNRKQAL